MTSSMLSGDRRWVCSSSKRGSMTVLGKVAVPKPINLPSKRFFVANIGDPKAVLAWSAITDGSQRHSDGVHALKAIVLTREHKSIYPQGEDETLGSILVRTHYSR